jgi:hypothetical protein
MLQIAVHADDGATPSMLQACEQRALVSEIARQAKSAHLGMRLGFRRDGVPGVIAAAVVHQDDFVADAQVVQRRAHRRGERGHVGLLVEERRDDREHGGLSMVGGGVGRAHGA